MPSQAGTDLTVSQRAELDLRLAAYRENTETAIIESQLRAQFATPARDGCTLRSRGKGQGQSFFQSKQF